MLSTNVKDWSVDDVCAWVKDLGFASLEPAFRDNAGPFFNPERELLAYKYPVSGKDLLELTEEDYTGSLHATHLQMKKIKRALNETLGVAEPSNAGNAAQMPDTYSEVPTPPAHAGDNTTPTPTSTPSANTYGIPPPLPNQPQVGAYQGYAGAAPGPGPGPGAVAYPPAGYPPTAPPYTAPPPNGYAPMPSGPPPPPPPPQWVPYGAPPPPGYTPSSYGGRPDCCIQ